MKRPTQYLYTFQGSNYIKNLMIFIIKIIGHAVDVEGNKIKIDNNNFLLRGCSLKNAKRKKIHH